MINTLRQKNIYSPKVFHEGISYIFNLEKKIDILELGNARQSIIQILRPNFKNDNLFRYFYLELFNSDIRSNELILIHDETHRRIYQLH